MTAELSLAAQRVLVVGAGGFLGRHLVPVLAAAGHQVTALGIREMDFYSGLPGVCVVVATEDGPTLERAVAASDAICHLAAFIPPDMETPSLAEACFRTNALFTLRLAQLAVEHRIPRFLYCSSGQIYQYSENPVAEDAPVYPAARGTYYLASKLMGELYVEHLRITAGLPAITFRLGNLYGPHASERSVVAKFMKAAAEGRPLEVWDSGVPQYDLVYARDIAALIVAALGCGEPGIYNAGSGQACSIMELAQAVAETFDDRKPEIVVKRSTGTMPPSFCALDIAKAAATWQFAPTPLRAALRLYRLEVRS